MKNIEELVSTLEENEAVIVFSEVNRRYLSGFPSSDGILTVSGSESRLYLDPRYFEAGILAQKNGAVLKDVKIFDYSDFSKHFSENTYKKVYFEDRRLTVSELEILKKKYPKTDFCPAGAKIEKLRTVKTEEEIKKISASQSLAEAAFSFVLNKLSPEMTETEGAALIEWFMKKEGASAPSFETICISGKRTSMPHGVPTSEKFGRNVFVTMDFGCMLDGYASDMTRTVCIGKADEKMKEVYSTVLSAQRAAIKKVKAGVPGSAVDTAARDIIKAAGYGGYFGHSTGHGVGLEVHESPSFSPKFDFPVPANAVLSVEPGIYLPGEFGVRIEDLVAVRESGCDDLNTSDKELIEL